MTDCIVTVRSDAGAKKIRDPFADADFLDAAGELSSVVFGPYADRDARKTGAYPSE